MCKKRYVIPILMWKKHENLIKKIFLIFTEKEILYKNGVTDDLYIFDITADTSTLFITNSQLVSKTNKLSLKKTKNDFFRKKNYN